MGDGDDRSLQPRKTFHTFFKPSNGNNEREHPEDPSSAATSNNSSDRPKIKLKKKSFTLKTPWSPASITTTTTKAETPQPAKSASPPLHPFFTKQQPSSGSPRLNTTNRSSSNNKTNGAQSIATPIITKSSTPVPSQAETAIPSPAPSSPLPLPPLKKRIRDIDQGPPWPDKTIFQGGHIGVAASCIDNSTIEKTRVVPLRSCQQSRSHLQTIIHNGTAQYFTDSKQSATTQQQQQRQRRQLKTCSMSTTQIRHLIESVYPSCKSSPACQSLLDNMGKTRRQGRRRTTETGVRNMPWTELYRPTRVNELLGNRDDNVYLRDWLFLMKVAAPSAFERMSASQKMSKKKTKRLNAFLDDPLFYASMVDDKDDDDFVPSGRSKGGGSNNTKKQQRAVKNKPEATAMYSNLILLVGDHGSSKTAAVYTAAEEAGYQVFEIHPGVKRSGKDLVAYVGEMTSSHLVTSHPTRATTTTTAAAAASSSSSSRKRKRATDTGEKNQSINNTSATTNESHFMRRFAGVAGAPTTTAAAATEAPEIDVIHVDDEDSSQGSHQTTAAASTAAAAAASEAQQQQQQQQQGEQGPKQSLVLLEEVDTLFEDDKGFWASVIELAQKSKRPIVLTCNDRNLIPTDMLCLQGTLDYTCPDIEELMAYLHLLCFSEGYLVHPADLAGLVATTGNDLRRLINTLELWCTESNDNTGSTTDIILVDIEEEEGNSGEDHVVTLYDCADLFNRYAGIADANTTGDSSNGDRGFDSTSRIVQQLFRIQQPSSKCGVDLVRFHEKCIADYNNDHGDDIDINNNNNNSGRNSGNGKRSGYSNSLLESAEQLDRASWGDVLMGTSARRNHQLHECDEYGPSQDQLLGYTTMWKYSTDLDHWSLSEDMASYFCVQAYQSIKDDEWRKALLPTVWEELVKERALTIEDGLFGGGDLISWRAYLSDTMAMMDYVPHIRMMCNYDQGVASRGRARRTRRKRRYLPLTDEQVGAVLENPEYRDTTDDWCEKTIEWSKRFIVVVDEIKDHTPISTTTIHQQ